MSSLRIFDIAGSALSAQMVRLNTTASNMANAESVSGSEAEAYRARHPVFATVLDDQLGQDTAAVEVLDIVQSEAPLRQEYQPAHPMANAEGYVFLPNVNVVEEMADMISASRSYQTNVEMLNTSKQLLLKTLSLGQ